MAMTKEKAKEIINNFKKDFRSPGAFELMNALEVAIKALDKLSEYEQIGTVSDCRRAIEKVRLQSQIGEEDAYGKGKDKGKGS